MSSYFVPLIAFVGVCFGCLLLLTGCADKTIPPLVIEAPHFQYDPTNGAVINLDKLTTRRQLEK